MPTVPKIQQQVRDEALPGVRFQPNATPSAFGGGPSLEQRTDAGEAVGKKIMDIGVELQQQADESAVTGLDLKASREQIRIDSEIKKQQGKNAASGPDYAKSEWTSASEKILAEASNDRQREAIKKRLSVRQMNSEELAHTHMGPEIRRYDNDQSKAYISSAQGEAEQNFRNTDRINLSIYQQSTELERLGVRNGDSRAVIDEKILKSAGDTHVRVINQYLANEEDQSAKEYFKQNEKFILGDDRVKIQKELHSGTQKGEAQRASLNIFMTAKSRSDALDMVDKVKPDIQDDVRSRVKSRYDEEDKAEAELKKKRFNFATESAVKAGTLDAIPETIKVDMTDEELNKVGSILKAKRDQKQSDPATKQYLQRLAATDTSAFLSKNPMSYADKLSEGDLKNMSDLQYKLAKNDKSALEEMDGYRSNEQIIDTTLKSSGYNPNPKRGSDESKSVVKYRELMAEKIKTHTAQTGKQPTPEQVQSFADDLMIKDVVEKGSIWDTRKRSWESSAGAAAELTIDDIPPTARTQIEAEFKRQGKIYNDAQVLNIYNRHAGRTPRGNK